ncbi:hypothetical protein MBT84_43990 [Streptomyces sp. MBT84]|nr:hypothetical protein [Streptomyces sp. MBT84]
MLLSAQALTAFLFCAIVISSRVVFCASSIQGAMDGLLVENRGEPLPRQCNVTNKRSRDPGMPWFPEPPASDWLSGQVACRCFEVRESVS